MSYALVITPAAEDQLIALPAELASFVRLQLARLSENPTVLSKPTSILQTRGQLFEVKFDRGGVVVWIRVVFRFGQDEQSLFVEHVAVEFGRTITASPFARRRRRWLCGGR